MDSNKNTNLNNSTTNNNNVEGVNQNSGGDTSGKTPEPTLPQTTIKSVRFLNAPSSTSSSSSSLSISTTSSFRRPPPIIPNFAPPILLPTPPQFLTPPLHLNTTSIPKFSQTTLMPIIEEVYTLETPNIRVTEEIIPMRQMIPISSMSLPPPPPPPPPPPMPPLLLSPPPQPLQMPRNIYPMPIIQAMTPMPMSIPTSLYYQQSMNPNMNTPHISYEMPQYNNQNFYNNNTPVHTPQYPLWYPSFNKNDATTKKRQKLEKANYAENKSLYQDKSAAKCCNSRTIITTCCILISLSIILGVVLGLIPIYTKSTSATAKQAVDIIVASKDNELITKSTTTTPTTTTATTNTPKESKSHTTNSNKYIINDTDQSKGFLSSFINPSKQDIKKRDLFIKKFKQNDFSSRSDT